MDHVSDCTHLKSDLGFARSEITALKEQFALLFSQIQSLNAFKTQYESNENHLKSELFEKDRVIHRQHEEVCEHHGARECLLTVVEAKSIDAVSIMLQEAHDAALLRQSVLNAETDCVRVLKAELETRNKSLCSCKLIMTHQWMLMHQWMQVASVGESKESPAVKSTE